MRKHRAWLMVLMACCGLATMADGGSTVHTVVPTECKPYFTWQTLGIFYSHRKTGQSGPMTRILCCTPEEYDQLPEADKTLLAPSLKTHVAASFTYHPRNGDVYHAYNKPVAIIDWLAKTEVKEDYVLVIDADMIMRETFLPDELGAKPGWAVSAYFGYMMGVDNKLALKHVPEIMPRNDTLAGRKGRRGDMAGGFTLMHREDLRRVAPLWLKYTEDVRNDCDAWNLTGDEYTKKPCDKPWISEMYGYSYGCAKADVWHHTYGSHMLYPGYDVMDPPKVLHYGLHWRVDGTTYEWDKHWHYDFDPLSCPPWNLSDDPRTSKKGLFAHPPRPAEFPTDGFELLRDLLSVEPVITLNAAFCERYLRVCPPSDQLKRECGRARALEAELDKAFCKLQLPDPCTNTHKDCEFWAKRGECEKAAGYMFSHCRLACKMCTPRNRNEMPLSHAAASPPPPGKATPLHTAILELAKTDPSMLQLGISELADAADANGDAAGGADTAGVEDAADGEVSDDKAGQQDLAAAATGVQQEGIQQGKNIGALTEQQAAFGRKGGIGAHSIVLGTAHAEELHLGELASHIHLPALLSHHLRLVGLLWAIGLAVLLVRLVQRRQGTRAHHPPATRRTFLRG